MPVEESSWENGERCFLCWHPGQTPGYASNDSASGVSILLQAELTRERVTPSLPSLEAA